MNIEAMLDVLVKKEGGFVNNPADKGGPTKYGITERTARAFGYVGDMRDLPEATARTIYKRRYWEQPRFDIISGLSEVLAEELLDTGVNLGPSVAGKFLQRALSVLQPHKLDVDGVIGQMTLYELEQFLKARGADGERVVTAMCNAQQSVRYIELAEADASQMQFEYGWQRLRVL